MGQYISQNQGRHGEILRQIFDCFAHSPSLFQTLPFEIQSSVFSSKSQTVIEQRLGILQTECEYLT